MPALSVLLPVRDAAPWLESSLASLSRQTFTDFEIVAVDDGSRDRSPDILARWAAREPRLRFHAMPARGLPAALAEALRDVRAPLIARHDADDLSHRERFAEQVDYLVRHPDVGVLGSRLRLFPSAASGGGMRRWRGWHDALLSHEAMQRECLIDSPLAHGTAMLRRAALERVGGWRERGWAEDLDLWIRLFEAGVRFAKLPRVLYAWRQHSGSATRTDPRYGVAPFVALKRQALDRGLLSHGRRATLVGTGVSLERWRDALGARVARVLDRKRPSSSDVRSLRPPIVLVCTSSRVRERWRAVLFECGLSEMVDFVFVA